MSEALVSIVVPCYNAEAYVHRLLDSILSQTYKKLELILINDGSTDDTGKVIKSYTPLLEEAGIKVTYIEQENGGQSAAINVGIKLVSGDFMTWPDSDDWLTPDSIERRVRFLQEHPEVAMVRCNIEKIQEDTGASLGLFEAPHDKPVVIDNLFEKLRDCKTWMAPVAFLVRMSHFDQVNPEHDIYVHRKAGQNVQMMLPLAQNFPCWQLPEVSGYYLIRANSHSHSQKTFANRIEYEDICEQVVLNTLSRIKADDAALTYIKQQYAWKRILIAKKHAPLTSVITYVKKAWPVVAEKNLLVLAVITPRNIFRLFKNRLPGV